MPSSSKKINKRSLFFENVTLCSLQKMSSGTTAVRCWLKKKGERRRVSFQCPMCERRLPLKSLLSHISGSHVFAELKSLVKRKFPGRTNVIWPHTFFVQ